MQRYFEDFVHPQRVLNPRSSACMANTQAIRLNGLLDNKLIEISHALPKEVLKLRKNLLIFLSLKHSDKQTNK
ncbi:hypothetical protein BpHYR1_035101 [Brachionus plicatilis]|uniref:Uncharacterized protein n=1 Tax=Brachionus plicatilis TaxID=10195 RepID=A0A3M7Q907_BRAPC|nr:hypothetical protein BpHYR1_035101 [Brachionus plicatilis]